MIVLLPPSEGKIAATSGKPVSLHDLPPFPELFAARREVIDALTKVSARANALEILGVGARISSAVVDNLTVLTRPAAPAYKTYAGVLYDAGQFASRGRLAASGTKFYVQSALFGLIDLTARIPSYRLSLGTDLPGVGNLAKFWRKHLTETADAKFAGEVIVDCRSGTYVNAWKAPKNERIVVKAETATGRVISHAAKKWRGIIAGQLLGEDATFDLLMSKMQDLIDNKQIARFEMRDTKYGADLIVIPKVD
ncbi:MAG: peroxide stress protein YaaA [Actinomycetaceae bacterium]|nr:peroxide stress protein YaaA [Actinomycetaceae bacterium]